jgi:rare lipoprotein A
MMKILKVNVFYCLTVFYSISLTGQTGFASFYAEKFHAERGASGELVDTDRLIAAHRTIKFGNKARVTRLDNGKTVIVRIVDRGPFTKGRVIDLSYKAAKRLDFINDGTCKVKVEEIIEPVFTSDEIDMMEEDGMLILGDSRDSIPPPPPTKRRRKK